jgi:Na+-driven multidrug efflux pump
MINICSFAYQIPAGVAVAASVLVGKAIGSREISTAKQYT